MRGKVAYLLALGSLVALVIARDLARKAREAADLKSGLGDVHAALHLEDLAAIAILFALLSAFCSITLALRDPVGERLFIALGASAALASIFFWP